MISNILWFPSKNNVFAEKIEHELEIAKADLGKLEFDKSKHENRIIVLEHNITVLNNAIENMKITGFIIRLQEYRRVTQHISLHLNEIAMSQSEIKAIEPLIKSVNQRITDLKYQYEAVRFKLLEFKKRG